MPERRNKQEGAAFMAKNRIKVSILGSDYIITSEEEENYVRQIAAETEKRIAGITRDNPRLSVTMAAVLAALDYCDEAVKATESADNLRSQIKDYLEDSSQARMEAEEARRENEKLKKEVQTLRSRLEHQAAEPKKTVQVPPGRTVAAPAPISRPAGQSRVYSQPEPEQKEKGRLDQEIMEFFQSGEAEE